VIARGGTAREFAAAVRRTRLKRTPAYGAYALTEDAVETIGVADWAARMRETTMLTFGGEGWGGRAAPMREFGMTIKEVPFAELNDAWEKADPDAAEEVALTWKNAAAKVEQVTFETLKSSAAMYLAQKAMLDKYRADGLTINCLGGFYGNQIHAYPCLAFHQLMNEGIVGACECDLISAVTMLALTKLTRGRTGFISDPVIDTSKRQIIYAHCVAFNRAFGPQGPENPFEIHTHSEDRQGASVRSLLPTGYMTTTVKMLPRSKKILLHQAAAVDNIVEDMACRTKLAGEVFGDMEKLIAGWGDGWHRVTVYGDLKEQIHETADALGWRVVEEA
jgi:L-fucose isomerase-like protein